MVPRAQLPSDTTGINSSHVIHKLSFGASEFPGQVNPLDGAHFPSCSTTKACYNGAVWQGVAARVPVDCTVVCALLGRSGCAACALAGAGSPTLAAEVVYQARARCRAKVLLRLRDARFRVPEVC